jgi:hypothetical protein
VDCSSSFLWDAGRKYWDVLDGEGRKVAMLQSSAFTPSSTDLQSLAGEYRSSELNVTYMVTVQGRDLVIQPPGRADIRLRACANDIFAGNSVGTVTFLRGGARGAIRGFTVTRDNARGVRFDRVNGAR